MMITVSVANIMAGICRTVMPVVPRGIAAFHAAKAVLCCGRAASTVIVGKSRNRHQSHNENDGSKDRDCLFHLV